MEPNTIAVVLNPAAGGGKTLKALPKVHLALQSLGRPYQVYLTTAAGDGVKAVRAICPRRGGIGPGGGRRRHDTRSCQRPL